MDGILYVRFSQSELSRLIGNNFTTDWVNQIKTPADQLLKNLNIYDAIRIDEKRISLGTWGFGSVIIDTAFNLITVIDKESGGLQDDIVKGQFMDKTG